MAFRRVLCTKLTDHFINTYAVLRLSKCARPLCTHSRSNTRSSPSSSRFTVTGLQFCTVPPVLCKENLSVNVMQTRHYWDKKAPRTPPTKPLSFDYSGDLTHSIGTVDLSQPKLGFDIPELESADDAVKKMFSLEFSTKAEVIQKVIEDLVDKVKDHPLDIKSLEVKIATDTVIIRNKIQHCLRFRNDKIVKVRLIERIHQRRNRLKLLKSRDVDKFNWLVEELQIRLPPDLTKHKQVLSKKGLRKKMARLATIEMKKQKNEELRKRLAEEKKTFDEFREKELADIEQSLQELGVTEMTSVEQVLTELGMSELVRKPPKIMRKSELIWQKKMEKFGEQKKQTDAEILRAHGFIVPKSLLS